MTDKKRLEEIRNRMIVEKQHFKYLNSEKGYWENVYTILEQDMKYLFDTIIEQAERADKNAQDLEDMDRQLYREQQQNKRYRATINAMQQILKDAIHSLDVGEKVQGLEYGVSMAEKALEGEE